MKKKFYKIIQCKCSQSELIHRPSPHNSNALTTQLPIAVFGCKIAYENIAFFIEYHAVFAKRLFRQPPDKTTENWHRSKSRG